MTSPTPASQASPPQHRDPTGLLIAVMLALLGATIAAAVAGLRFDLPIGLALALQYGLALATTWAVRDAVQLRRRAEVPLEPPTPDAVVDTADRAANETPTVASIAADPVHARQELDEARSMQFLFLATSAALIAFLSAIRLWTSGSAAPAAGESGAAAILLLLLACLWQAFAKVLSSLMTDTLPESSALGEALRESMWATLIAGGALLAGAVVPTAPLWGTRLILAWVLAVASEQVCRAAARWQFTGGGDDEFRAPVSLLLREAVLMRANPVSSLFDVFERRFGLSLRSSWALAFVRMSLRPAAGALAVFVWSISGLAVVDTHQWGIREQFGRVVGEPLSPGLHVSLPWPLGRIRVVPVKTVSTMQLGFRDAHFSGRMSQKKALLWTKPHDEEFLLVLGAGTELVAINAIVYYKISEVRAAFFDYVYRSQSPEAALEAFAYRVLMEETQALSLEELLSRDREAFVNRVLTSLRDYAARERLGLEVVDVAVVNLHPPVEAAAAYLDTISAGIDADRAGIEAHGRVASDQRSAEQQRWRMVNDSRIDAVRRLAAARAETSRFRAAREVYELEGSAFQVRLVFDALREMFRGKHLVLVDRELAAGAAEVLLDLRELTTPEAARRLDPAVGETSP